MYTLAVTGGTGSLGKAILAHQDYLESNGISRIRIISRDEIKQDDLERSYKGKIEIQCILGDVRSKDRMDMALKDCHYLIHAAALKIVPKIEYDVPEAIRTNLGGTENVLKSFLQNKKAKSGLFVSTDKAVDPLNAYGFTKAAAERLWLWGMMFQNETKLSVCRYGNVLGSRGSVVFHWAKALEKDDPLKITSKDMTRFFIRLEDASHFVLDRLFNNKGGEIYIPRMKSTPMINLGEVMSYEDCKKGADWEVIGLREGEKIHEVLTSINDKVIYSRDKSHIALRPLTPLVQCYQENWAHPELLEKPISSETAEPLTYDEMTAYYREWKSDYRRSLGSNS